MKLWPNDPMASQVRYSLLLQEIDVMRAARGVSSVALVLVKLSGLEDINARFGYPGGDKALEQITGRIGAIARDQDRIFEIRRTVFAFLLRNPVHEGHAVLAAERIASLAEQPVTIGADSARLRARSGVALLSDPAAAGQELLRQAEIALAIARERDEVSVVFTPALGQAFQTDNAHTWFDVDEALKAGEFELFYQPKVTLPDGGLAGAEALLRWHSPTAGYVLPGKFLPAVEHTQGIRAILRFALNAGLRQAASWDRFRPGFTVAVNLAAGNLRDRDLVDVVRDALNVWNVPPPQLVLELTESSLMSDPAFSILTMSKLRALGVRTSIDDFGTGYSSLSYLKDVPADELKIDRSFVSLVTGDEKDRRIAASIAQLGHAVGMTVVGEGVEDAATASVLADIGCDIAQGYHFGAPMPADVFEKLWLRPGEAASA